MFSPARAAARTSSMPRWGGEPLPEEPAFIRSVRASRMKSASVRAGLFSAFTTTTSGSEPSTEMVVRSVRKLYGACGKSDDGPYRAATQ